MLVILSNLALFSDNGFFVQSDYSVLYIKNLFE